MNQSFRCALLCAIAALNFQCAATRHTPRIDGPKQKLQQGGTLIIGKWLRMQDGEQKDWSRMFFVTNRFCDISLLTNQRRFVHLMDDATGTFEILLPQMNPGESFRGLYLVCHMYHFYGLAAFIHRPTEGFEMKTEPEPGTVYVLPQKAFVFSSWDGLIPKEQKVLDDGRFNETMISFKARYPELTDWNNFTTMADLPPLPRPQ